MIKNDWREDDGRNVFQMIIDAGGPGIWIRRTTWNATCARIIAMGEVRGGAPYFGNPSVLMDVYGLDGELRDELAQVSAAGTFKTWRQIHPPEWSNGKDLRALNDPKISSALNSLDRLRGKAPSTKQIELTVPFERKDEAKALGAKWNPRRKRWWLPAQDSEEAQAKARKLGFLD